MCFANVEGGMEINLDKMKEHDLVKILFSENPGIVIQVSDKHKEEVKQILEDAGVGYVKIGKPTDERHILVSKDDATYQFGIDYMRDVWYSTSYLLDRKQSMNGCAKNASKTIRCSLWNSLSCQVSKVNSLNTALIRIVVPRQVSVQQLSARKVRMVNAKWPTHCTWQDSM